MLPPGSMTSFPSGIKKVKALKRKKLKGRGGCGHIPDTLTRALQLKPKIENLLQIFTF